MGTKTAISWCDATWNPLAGCSRVSPGCDHCYAFQLHDRRYAQNQAAARATGTSKTRAADIRAIATSPHVGGSPVVGKPDHPLPWPQQYDWPFSEVQLFPDRLGDPLHWRKPRRIFVNSMSDLFHESVPTEFIDRVFAIMALAPRHTFQVLTKRPERARMYLRDVHHGCGGTETITRIARVTDSIAPVELRARWPLPNVWLGVSVENQHWADIRIPLLLQTPAAVRFISAEPLLGPVDLTRIDLGDQRTQGYGSRRITWDALTCWEFQSNPGAALGDAIPGTSACVHERLDWVIVGGESGPHARPMDHAWVRAIRDQCREAGVAYFGKQDSGATQGRPLPGDLGDREFPQ